MHMHEDAIARSVNRIHSENSFLALYAMVHINLHENKRLVHIIN